MSVTNRLRLLREGAGLTQAQLAERLAVSRQTIISVESGRYSPSLELALRIAVVFGLPVEQLFMLETSSANRS